MKKKMLSGLQPSGELTIGNYIGSISQFKDYEEEYETYIFIPDLHAITVTQDPETLTKKVKSNLALYLACGLDEEKNIFFIQSENPYHTNLSWLLECNTQFGELSRMTQFKDKSSKNQSFSCGLYTYPVLMAADILLYNADVVPVGQDQKQHVELARDLAERFNKRYGKTFTMPLPIIPKVGAKIKDLQDPTKKMSKSSENKKGVIYILDTEKDIRKKIASAVTDMENKVYFDEENKPGISNLLTIYSSLTNKSIEESEQEFKENSYKEFKDKVANTIVLKLTEIQNKYNEIINSDMVDKILDKGRDISIEIAKAKYEEARKKMGLGRK